MTRPPRSRRTRPSRDRGRRDRPPAAGGTTGSLAESPVGRYFWAFLAGICLVVLVIRIVALLEFVRSNPFADMLRSDALVYWEWAGRIAGGALVGDRPFLSAPLYPYLLGLVRFCGGGLFAVYVLQLIIHLVTAGGIGVIGRARFGPAVGLLSAAVFVLLTEPAFDATRLLPSTLQNGLLVALWGLLVVAQRKERMRWYAAAGVVLGLNCLANPPFVVLILLLGLWVATQAERPTAGLRHAAILAAGAMVTVSFATLHNALACGEFIPVTAHAGITFRHGNGPGADGTHTEIPGVSRDRDRMHDDAIRLVEKATGKPATWREVDRYFYMEGLRFWSSNPIAAMRLAARKLHAFLSFRNYGDIYLATAERACGLSVWMVSAPVPVPWLMGPAIVGLVRMLRQPRRYGVEAALFVVPLVVVVLFWYTPRYRLPVVPVLAVVGAWALHAVMRWRAHPGWAGAVIASLLLSLALGPINRALGEDPLPPHVAGVHFQLADCWRRRGEPERTIRHLREGLEIAPHHVDAASAHYNLANELAANGNPEEAIDHYEQALDLDPTHIKSHVNCSNALIALGRSDEAMEHLQAAIRIDPGFATAHYNLGNLLARRGGYADAVLEYRAAILHDPDHFKAHLYLGAALSRQQRFDEAVAAFRKAVALRPEDPQAHYDLGVALSRIGEQEQAIREYRATLRLDPTHEPARRQLGMGVDRIEDE